MLVLLRSQLFSCLNGEGVFVGWWMGMYSLLRLLFPGGLRKHVEDTEEDKHSPRTIDENHSTGAGRTHTL